MTLPNWLVAYPSISSPYVYLPLAIAIVVLVTALMRRPYLFVPVMMWACPIPKLFSIGVTDENYEAIAGGTIISTARPGGSLGEVVVFAGLVTVLIKLLQGRASGPGSIAGALRIWIAAVLLSSAAGVLFSDVYRPAYVLHALRYSATLACYFIARHLTAGIDSGRLLRRAAKWFFFSGNTYVILAFAYYALWGSAKAPWEVAEDISGSTGIWRNYLFFFDYGYDYGMFGACVCLFNVSIYRMLSSPLARAAALAGGSLGAITAVLTGERGCILILVAGLFGLGWLIATRRSALRPNVAIILAGVGVMLVTIIYSSVVQPEGIRSKLSETTSDSGETAARLAIETGVDPAVASWIGDLNIGDFAIRMAVMAGALGYFLQHPWGAGFGAELAATGWFAHHDLLKMAVEEGVLGLIAFAFLLRHLLRFCWKPPALHGEASDLLRTVLVAMTFGVLAGMAFAVTTIYSLKFGLLYWTLLGVTDVPAARPGRNFSDGPDASRRVVGANTLAGLSQVPGRLTESI